MMRLFVLSAVVIMAIAASAAQNPAGGGVRLMILDPGHFHAALIQKTMAEPVSPVVDVYAPEGPELEDYLQRIRGFNSRADHPTSWELRIHAGPDFLDGWSAKSPGIRS